MLKNSIKLLLVSLLSLIVSCHANVDADSNRNDPGQIKLDKMRKLQAESSDGLIMFTAQTYK